MNSAKICVSVCARTAIELLDKIVRADGKCDLIEVRFDCLEEAEVLRALEIALQRPEGSTPLLATLRSPEEGGLSELSLEDRQRFWASGISKAFWGGDFEADVIDLAVPANWKNRIGSAHETSDRVLDPAAAYETLVATDASVIKIAVNAETATDHLAMWKLLERAKNDGRPLIPIAMGEAGKWTRIIGPAHGSYLTYAAAEGDKGTAPGQFSAEDMRGVFRVNELDRETEVFGIIAGDTSYTASPWMHNAAFKELDMNRVFVPLQVTDLDAFVARMVREETREIELNFRGFSVTNPHKQSIIKHLDHIDETAKKIGAVNTVSIIDGELHGFNTDAPGFVAPLKKSFGDLKGVRVGIVGAGGAARACTYALKQEGAKVTIFARRPKRATALAEEFGVKAAPANNSFRPGELDILVNATPMGTKGDLQEMTIATADQLPGIKLIYDLVYNPIQTRFLREARTAGVPALGGLDMVLAQGRKQFEIWTGETAPTEAMRSGLLKRLK